jgi:hypothetical protein
MRARRQVLLACSALLSACAYSRKNWDIIDVSRLHLDTIAYAGVELAVAGRAVGSQYDDVALGISWKLLDAASRDVLYSARFRVERSRYGPGGSDDHGIVALESGRVWTSSRWRSSSRWLGRGCRWTS